MSNDIKYEDLDTLLIMAKLTNKCVKFNVRSYRSDEKITEVLRYVILPMYKILFDVTSRDADLTIPVYRPSAFFDPAENSDISLQDRFLKLWTDGKFQILSKTMQCTYDLTLDRDSVCFEEVPHGV